MENPKPLNCTFGEHINNMRKEKLIDLCQKAYKDEPLENLNDLEPEELIKKYQSAWMDNFNLLQ